MQKNAVPSGPLLYKCFENLSNWPANKHLNESISSWANSNELQ